jgi:tRNA nucleotidyltransferase (CCA-adding enzyme)
MKDHLKTSKIILEKLEKHGFKSYIVGGAVRNILLNFPVKDVDITTDATPEQILSIFDRTIDLNQFYGTILVIEDDVPFEITTLRLESAYEDHRHPGEVKFTNDIHLDSNRRDFTVNALYMDLHESIYDFHQGKTDLQNKILRSIGSAKTRFQEDALRMLRAIRFVSEYNFQLDNEILSAIKNQKDDVLNLPSERIIKELDRIFEGDFLRQAFEALNETEMDVILFNQSIMIENIPLKFKKDAMWLYLINKGYIPSHWTLPKRLVKVSKQIFPYLNKKDFTPFDCFCLGPELSTLLQSVKTIYGFATVDAEMMNNQLPIHSLKELNISPNEIKAMLKEDEYNRIESIQLDCVKAIIDHKLSNQNDELLNFIEKKIKKGVKQ